MPCMYGRASSIHKTTLYLGVRTADEPFHSSGTGSSYLPTSPRSTTRKWPSFSAFNHQYSLRLEFYLPYSFVGTFFETPNYRLMRSSYSRETFLHSLFVDRVCRTYGTLFAAPSHLSDSSVLALAFVEHIHLYNGHVPY